MILLTTGIRDCLVVKPEIFYDFRGEYVETWNQENYKILTTKELSFVQDDFSVSRKNVLRGLHGDSRTWKLVQAPVGEFLLTVLDTRERSETYGRWEQFVLNDRNRHQVLIPAGCANGHLCLSEMCMFSYKQTEYYDRKSQFSFSYKSAGIRWPVNDGQLILSERDKDAPLWPLWKP